MKKKKFVLLACLAFLLASCLFDSDDEAFASWISDQGIPESYKVQTLNIPNLVPKKVNAYRDSSPTIMLDYAVFGNVNNMSHELVLEFVYISDSSYLKKMKSADSVSAFVYFNLLEPFYNSKQIKDLLLPINEDLKLNVSWKFKKGENRAFVDSIADIDDSLWSAQLKNWTPDASADTSYTVKIVDADSQIAFALPGAFTDSLVNCKKACHLELRLAAPESKNLFRFYTFRDALLYPLLKFNVSKQKSKIYTPYRIADITVNNDCSDCLVIHGGNRDSLEVEFPSEPILKALSDFYGDEFPNSIGDGFDVRQVVVFAEVSFARTDEDGESEFGLPVQVVTGSFMDSSGKEFRKMERYALNTKLIAESGHPNMVFYEGDSLKLQVTLGMRDFINRVSDGAKFKIMMRLGPTVLLDKDSSYRDTIYTKRIVLDSSFSDSIVSKAKKSDKVLRAVCDSVECDTIYTKEAKKQKVLKTEYDTSMVFLNYYDYARYDFSNMMKKPATLKLWLATKRADVMNKREEE